MNPHDVAAGVAASVFVRRMRGHQHATCCHAADSPPAPWVPPGRGPDRFAEDPTARRAPGARARPSATSVMSAHLPTPMLESAFGSPVPRGSARPAATLPHARRGASPGPSRYRRARPTISLPLGTRRVWGALAGSQRPPPVAHLRGATMLALRRATLEVMPGGYAYRTLHGVSRRTRARRDAAGDPRPPWASSFSPS